MKDLKEILAYEYFHNTVQEYLISLGIILAGLALIRFFKSYVLSRAILWSQRTKTHFDDFVIGSVKRFGVPAMYYMAIYIGLEYLNLTQRAHNILKIATTLVVTLLIIRLVSTIIRKLLRSYVRRRTNDEEKVKQVSSLMLIINIFIWVIGCVFLFDNMGYDVTTVVTGLGIGGIAVALAAQNILGDLFNYFVIFFDRPFEIGDYINVDGKTGTVEQIGIKTTRVRSLTGEQLIFANSDLTGSRIHNFKRMMSRRISFTIGVTYQTTHAQLKQIPEMIKSIIEQQDNVTFARAHFHKFGESSLDFDIVYFVLDDDYEVYMNKQQAINLGIFEEFEKQGIEFAYPTRTLFMQPVTLTNQQPEA